MSAYRVSAIVSAYNSERFIVSLLEDLTQQTLYVAGGLEIIFVDSQSPQNEMHIVREYQKKFPHIQYLRTAERETLYGAWNSALALAKGDYITNANTDDRHRHDALELLAHTLDHKAQVSCAYGNCLATQQENESFAQCTSTKLYSFNTFFAPDVVFHYQFGPQALWRKSVHDNVGFFNKNLKAAGDWEFNFRFNLAGLRAVHVPETLGLFLESASSVSNADNSSFQEQAEIRKNFVTPENILSLYAQEGWAVASESEQTKALNNCALRALNVHLPWEPEKQFTDLGISLLCLQAALERTSHSLELQANLASVWALAGKQNEALQLLQSIATQNPALAENLRQLEQGRLEGLRFFE